MRAERQPQRARVASQIPAEQGSEHSPAAQPADALEATDDLLAARRPALQLSSSAAGLAAWAIHAFYQGDACAASATLCSPMRVLPTRLEGLVVIEPAAHADARGFFVETYRHEWHGDIGMAPEQAFVQDNHSRSTRGVVRGMHFQVGAGVAKLVRCARGSILDVAVDLRRGSPTYGEWEGVKLDEESLRELYVPVGFAHGFCVHSDVADVIYKQTGYYDGAVERGIAWNDPDVGVEWGLAEDELTVSERDALAPRLSEIGDELPFEWHP